MPPSHDRINVAAEAAQPGSILSYYRALIALRRRERALHDGAERLIDVGNGQVLSWLREQGGRRIVVACNFTAEPQAASLGEAGRSGRTLLASYPGAPATARLDHVVVPPFGAWIAAID